MRIFLRLKFRKPNDNNPIACQKEVRSGAYYEACLAGPCPDFIDA